MSINDSVPVHNDWAAAYYIIVFCELIPRTDTEDIRNPLLSSLRKVRHLKYQVQIRNRAASSVPASPAYGLL